MQKRKVLAIDAELLTELRKFAFHKHKTGYGSIRKEAEAAIRAHIGYKGEGA